MSVSIKFLAKGIQTPMAQGQSTKIISTIKWIRTCRLSIKNSLSLNKVVFSLQMVAIIVGVVIAIIWLISFFTGGKKVLEPVPHFRIT
jgi:hypothetical protein